jgi:hypothetical protein
VAWGEFDSEREEGRGAGEIYIKSSLMIFTADEKERG